MLNLSNFPYILLSLLAVLVALTVHEFFHALAAYKLGDNTAAAYGRLTLNPLKHLDPLGALCMLVFHFGWAKPVPINIRNFRKPKRDFALSALAGPMSNIALGFIFALIYLLCAKFLKFTDNKFLDVLINNTIYFVTVFHLVNVGLGVFNLLPIPPFDGSRLVTAILPDKIYVKFLKYERYVYWGIIIWLLLGGYVYNILMSFPIVSNTPILANFFKIFSLSTLISEAVEFISGLMIWFWQLIPALR